MLLHSCEGALTQRFGPSNLGVEPAMYSTGDKAYWLPYFGASYFDDFHPGIDRAATYGTRVNAMEAGTVVFAGWKDNISGFQVEVEIRPNTRFSMNHLSKIAVKVGQKVTKGQKLGEIGTSGATTGPHVHEGLSIREPDSKGIYRTFLYNPSLFQAGGKYANDPRVEPEVRQLRLDDVGVNIYHAPIDPDDLKVFAINRGDKYPKGPGIYRRYDGKRIASNRYRFVFLRWRDTGPDTFAIVTGFGKRLAINKKHIRFVD